MKITVSTKSNRWTNFEKKEWPEADKEHYGQIQGWKKTKFKVAGVDGSKIAAVLRMDIQNGVAFIEALIVGKSQRGKGIGKRLVREAEKIAKQNGAHKIHLQTGRNWDSVSFYKNLGYEISGDLPNHYFHADFIEMTKFLE